MSEEITKIIEQLSPENMNCIVGYAGLLLKKQQEPVRVESIPVCGPVDIPFEKRIENLDAELKETIGILGKIPIFEHVDMDELMKVFDVFNMPGGTVYVASSLFAMGRMYGIRAERERRAGKRVSSNAI